MRNDGLLQDLGSAELQQVAVQGLQGSPDAIVIVDASGRVVFFNASAEQLWQRKAADMLGSNGQHLIEQPLQAPLAAQAAHQTQHQETLIRRADGSAVRVHLTLQPLERADETWTIAYLRDMTEAHSQHALMLQRALVVEQTDNAIMVCSPDRSVLQINPGFTRLLGYTQQEMLGKRAIDVLAGPHTDVAALLHAGGGGPGPIVSYRAESMIYTKTGQPLWVAVVVDSVKDAQGQVTSVVVVLSDITLTKMHQVLQHRVLDAMVRELPVAAVMGLVCDEAERIAPDVFCSVLEVDTHGLMHPLAGPQLPAALGDALKGQAIAGTTPCSCGNSVAQDAPVPVIDIANDPLWLPYRDHVLPLGIAATWACPIRSSDGSVVGAFSLYFKTQRGPTPFEKRLAGICVQLCALAIERERVRDHVHQLATFDLLTGLVNRATVRTRSEALMAGLPQASLPLAVLCIGLDRFKYVNEAQGHEAGDALLREVADRLLRSVRSIDLIGRLAGDEFVAILPACPDEQAALAASRIQAAIAQPLQLDGVTLVPSASIGVAMYPSDGDSIDALLHHADLAMVQAKADGRGGTRFFNDAMQRRARERVAMEQALRLGLRNGALTLSYQPQIDCTAAGRLHGVEALARWSRPLFGEVPPSQFIPLAEETGLIDELGRWALAEACSQMGRWRARGIAVPHVAVNLSARNFHDEGLPAMVEQLLRQNGLVASDLTLEMTESAMLDASFGVVATIEALRAMGIQLSLDDFGTGYSSLSYLHRLPMDELKLDQSFVRDLAGSATARALTNTILRIGDSLELTVVAEGVETEDQADFLKSKGCAVLQGFLYGRPMAADAFEHWLAERAATAPVQSGAG